MILKQFFPSRLLLYNLSFFFMQMNVIKFERFIFATFWTVSLLNMCSCADVRVFSTLQKGNCRNFNEFTHQSFECYLNVTMNFFFDLNKIWFVDGWVPMNSVWSAMICEYVDRSEGKHFQMWLFHNPLQWFLVLNGCRKYRLYFITASIKFWWVLISRSLTHYDFVEWHSNNCGPDIH